MEKKNKTLEENIVLKTAFIRILRKIFTERRKYLGFDVKNVSAALATLGTRISKEDIHNFEKGIDELKTEKVLVMAKFYKVGINDIIEYAYHLTDKDVENEIKKNNNNISRQYIDELSVLVGFNPKK